MASIGISATIPRSCTSRFVTKKHSPPATRARASSVGTKQETHIVTSNSESQKLLTLTQKEDNPLLLTPMSRQAKDEEQPTETEASAPKFSDKRWKNGTWDLNMFIKHGKMDWHTMIFAGRAAMVGFFMSYLVDALTRLDVVGQTGNFMCKAALFLTVIGVVLFRREEDFENLQRLADEATFYDKQWQASRQDQNDRSAGSD